MISICNAIDDSDTVQTSEHMARRSFYEGTEMEFIDENDPVVFSCRSTVAANQLSNGVQCGNDSDVDSDASIIG